MVRIGIIGTAGRKDDADRMTKELYEKMKIIAYRIITHIEPDLSKIELFSGGAAWSDHLAVNLYLEHLELKLTLCLPCEWGDGEKSVKDRDGENGARDKESKERDGEKGKKSQYLDNGIYNYLKNPGKTSNYYHQKFSEKMGHDTLKEIDICIKKGANIKIEYGFQARNNLISQNIDYLIAFTWGIDSPKDGGTLNTWKSCPSSVKKRHVSLGLF